MRPKATEFLNSLRVLGLTTKKIDRYYQLYECKYKDRKLLQILTCNGFVDVVYCYDGDMKLTSNNIETKTDLKQIIEFVKAEIR